MAARKFWLTFGQSNAGPSADYATWAARHAFDWSLDSASSISTGSYSDTFAMPGGFPGYGTLDMSGVAISDLRYLVFYSPYATGYRTFPNEGGLRVGAHTTTVLLVEQTFEAAAIGMVLVRKKTGTSHTITAVTPGAGGATITVTPAFSPAPIDREEFTYQMAGLTGTTTVVLPLGFGSLWDGNLLGLRLVCVSGANAGQSRIIQSWTNSTRSAVLDSAFSSAIGSSDTFEIRFPGDVPFRLASYFLPYTPYLADYTDAKRNPFPPGFRQPTHWHVPIPVDLPGTPSGNPPTTISYHVTLGLRLQEFLGETIYMLSSEFGGTTIAHREGVTGDRAGWWDVSQQSDWSPGRPSNCYARMLEELARAKALTEADGDTLELIGVSYPQGETDATDSNQASRYLNNVRSLKRALRRDLKAMGIWTGPVEKIPFIHPEIAGSDALPGYEWPYADNINQGIRQACEEDRFAETFSVADLPRKSSDPAHYTGDGADMLGERVFDAWRRIYKTTTDTGAVDICNLALSHIGQSPVVTSIDPPDASAQAALCAQYYQQALETVFVARQWSFAMRRKSLAAVTYTGLTQWRYAYQLPADALRAVAVQPPNSTDDYTQPGDISGAYSYVAPIVSMRTPQRFDIEHMQDGTRVILSNTENAVLRYVARVADTTQYPPQFRLAVSYQLASMLAGPVLKGDVGAAESKRLMQVAAYYMGAASTTDANQRDVQPEHVPDWLADR